MTDAERIASLETELGRAYRALLGYSNCVKRGEPPDGAMRAYHSLSVGAAKRFVYEGALDGSEYFIGKPVEVLHAALQLPNGLEAQPDTTAPDSTKE